MTQDLVTTEGSAVGGPMTKPREKRPPCRGCADARQELILLHQTAANWGRYRPEYGIRILDIADDPTVDEANKNWLKYYRAKKPSMLSDTELIVFIVRLNGVEQEVVVPHEALAALSVLASSPRPIRCTCGCECSPATAIIAPDLHGKLELYCRPMCHQLHTNPHSMTVANSIFGVRPRSEIWDGDPDFTQQGQAADAEVVRDWAEELDDLDNAHAEWDDAAKEELLDLYTESAGGLTLKTIASKVGVSESTISNWFRLLKE